MQTVVSAPLLELRTVSGKDDCAAVTHLIVSRGLAKSAPATLLRHRRGLPEILQWDPYFAGVRHPAAWDP